MKNINIVQGDITQLDVDAIVNAANSRLLGGGGVDGAIHRAGGPSILEECRMLRETSLPHGLPIGAAVRTDAGMLSADHVIHTVGPRYGTQDAERLLKDCYWRSLRLASYHGARTIAFPLISGGSYGWPTEQAVDCALAGIGFGPQSEFASILLVAYSRETKETMHRRLARTQGE